MQANPINDAIAFLTRPAWPTPVFWLLLLASLAIALRAWRHIPIRHGAREPVIWLLRVVVGCLWWQQSLGKLPPGQDRILEWMQFEVGHAALGLRQPLLRMIVLTHFALFAPFIYALQAGIATSLLLGLFTRLFAALGTVYALASWLGLYGAPHSNPWGAMMLVVVMMVFTVDPPGRALGVDAVLRRRLRPARLLALFS